MCKTDPASCRLLPLAVGASTASTLKAGLIPHTARELSKHLQLPAAAAQPLRVRIPAGSYHARSNVEQFVVGPVLADHKVGIRVIGSVLVNVMNFNAVWEVVAQRTFSDGDVRVNASVPASPRMAHDANMPILPFGVGPALVMSCNESVRLPLNKAPPRLALMGDRRELPTAALAESCLDLWFGRLLNSHAAIASSDLVW